MRRASAMAAVNVWSADPGPQPSAASLPAGDTNDVFGVTLDLAGVARTGTDPKSLGASERYGACAP